MLAIDSTQHDQAFLTDLHAARIHALGVLRSILNLATLTPEARAEFLKTGRAALALLRESRLAAAQILQLPLPLPEGGYATLTCNRAIRAALRTSFAATQTRTRGRVRTQAGSLFRPAAALSPPK